MRSSEASSCISAECHGYEHHHNVEESVYCYCPHCFLRIAIISTFAYIILYVIIYIKLSEFSHTDTNICSSYSIIQSIASIYTYFWKWNNTLHDDLQCNYCMYLYCKCYLGSFPSCTSCSTPTVESRTTSGDMRHRADSCFDMDRRLRMVTCSSLRCRTSSVVGRERGHLKFLKHNTTSL